MSSGSVVNFDLSGETSNSYFKSSFARSMAFGSTSQSKSLDYVYLDEGKTIDEEVENAQSPDMTKSSSKSMVVEPLETSTPRKPRRSVPTLPTYELAAFPRELSASVRLARSRPNMTAPTTDPIKFWKMKQESTSKQIETATYSGEESTLLQEESKDDEILRLRKECQGLMEANRKLQSGTSSVDSSLLQSQIDTLQWQLKQAESNRQMYRAVMEQVSKFLERVHKALEGGSPSKYPQRGKSRPASMAETEVPRSRSVHTVVTQSRASSPSPSHTINVHRANSITQMQDNSYSSTYSRDCSWRGSRASAEEIAPERLSQDAFRLLRTVQSLLGTREPDLARVSDTSQRRDSTSMGSCSSLVQSSCCGTARESEDSKSNGGGPSTPQLSVGSTEDESGFSSMSSFHDAATNGDVIRANGDIKVASGDASRATNGEVNRSITNGEGSHHELGLPLVEPHRHRRWSSTPVDTGFRQPLRVLWCSRGTEAVVPNCAYKMTDIPLNRTAYSKLRYNTSD